MTDLQLHRGETIREMFAIADRALTRHSLGQCWYGDEYGQCRNRATVHVLEEDIEFCLEHYRKVVEQ